MRKVEEETGEESDELPRLDAYQEDIYRIYELFHATRRHVYGPEALSVFEMTHVLKLWGYKDVEEVVTLLVNMDLVYRSWWNAENQKDG